MSPGPRTILIVDDEPHVVHVVKFKLEKAGFRVLVASNGKRAYEIACEHGPDLVVTDFQMPGCNGVELAKQLAANTETAAIPMIMLTARSHLGPMSELAQTNVRCMLAKPFSPRNLIAKVEDLLGENLAETPSAEGGAEAEAA